MDFPNLASTSVSLRVIFWLYASKDESGASLTDLLDLVVLFHPKTIIPIVTASIINCKLEEDNFHPLSVPFRQKLPKMTPNLVDNHLSFSLKFNFMWGAINVNFRRRR